MRHRLLVTIAALASVFALSASVTLAAVPTRANGRATTTPVATSGHGCGHAYGHAASAGSAANPATPARPSVTPKRDGNADVEQNESDDETGTDNGGPDSGSRPHNHGWYVSQAAHDDSYVGREHGKHVSDVARSNDGKPDQASH